MLRPAERTLSQGASRVQPCNGRLVDTDGMDRLDKGELDDGTIASMNWFVHGVVGSFPRS